MITNQIIDYIKQQTQAGKTKEEIETSLFNAGWRKTDINEAFKSIRPKKKLLKKIILISLLLSLPIVVSAVEFQNPLEYETFGDLIDAIIKFIFYIAVVIAPLMIIIGAFYILTAGGDPKKIGTGKNIIIYTLVGLAIILLARGLIAIIESLIGVKIGG